MTSSPARRAVLLAVLVRARSARRTRVAEALPWLLAGFGSVSLAWTVARLVRVVPGVISAGTATITVMVAWVGLPVKGIAPSRQVTPASHWPWLGVALIRVTPAGKVSTTVTSEALPGP